jgi:hypothetical protein
MQKSEVKKEVRTGKGSGHVLITKRESESFKDGMRGAKEE